MSVSLDRDQNRCAATSLVHSRDGSTKKLRSACDACHAAKVRCSGELTCARCVRDGMVCHYSYRAHLGKPKGSLNKKTLEKMRARGEMPPVMLQRRASRAAEDVDPCILTLPLFDQDSSESTDRITLSPSWHMAAADSVLTPSPSYASMLGGTLADFDLQAADIFHAETLTPLSSSRQSSTNDQDDAPACHADKGSMVLLRDSHILNDASGIRSCGCIRALTDQMNNLHEMSPMRSAAGLDNILQCTQDASSHISDFLKCHNCNAEAHIYVLVAVLFSLMLDLILPLADSSQHSSRPRAPIRVGNYTMSGQLGDALEGVVVKSMIGILSRTMQKFERKVGFLSSERSCLAFLEAEIKRFKRGFDMIVAQTGE